MITTVGMIGTIAPELPVGRGGRQKKERRVGREKAQDEYARSINLVGRYPGVLLDQLSPTKRRDQLGGYTDNRPCAVRCVQAKAAAKKIALAKAKARTAK